MANSYNFNGLGMGLGNLSRLSNAKTHSISAENFTGAKGLGGMATEGTGREAARDLGQGWKISPSIVIEFERPTDWTPGTAAILCTISPYMRAARSGSGTCACVASPPGLTPVP